MRPQDHSLARARRVIALVFLANAGVAVAKIVAGGITDSAAVRADGFHSLIDAAANLLGLAALSYALQPPDPTHRYGHSKFETFASLGIVMLLAVLVVEIVRDAVERLASGVQPEISVVAFVVMGVTMAVNLVVAVIERRAGIAFDSDFLVADADQTAADVLVSAGVLVGISLAAAGVPYADTAASLLVAAAISIIGVRIIRRSTRVLLDHTAIPDAEIDHVVRRIPNVGGWHKIRSRGRADEVFMDLHITVEPDISVRRGHAIAHDVQDAIRERFPQVVDITVHVEPAVERAPARREAEADPSDSGRE